MTWVKLYDIDDPWDIFIRFDRALGNVSGPVYYALLLRLDQALHDLINIEQLENTMISALLAASTFSTSENINAQGGLNGNALQAASEGGYD